MQLADIFSVIQELIIHNIIQNPIFIKYGLAGLFVNGVLAATVLPIPTEVTVTALLASGHNKLPIVIVLAISTTLGGFTGYYLGRSGKKLSRLLPKRNKKEEQKEQKQSGGQKEERNYRFLTKYGWIAILISTWIPAAGDIMPIIAGARRYSLQKFAIVLIIGKTTKAIAIVYLGSLLSFLFLDAN